MLRKLGLVLSFLLLTGFSCAGDRQLYQYVGGLMTLIAVFLLALTLYLTKKKKEHTAQHSPAKEEPVALVVEKKPAAKKPAKKVTKKVKK